MTAGQNDLFPQNPASARHHGRQPIAERIPLVNDEQEAPRPIGVDPAATGSFQRITAEEGAKVENRESVARVDPDSTSSWAPVGYAAEKRLRGRRRPAVDSRERRLKGNRKLFVGLGVAAAVVVLVLALVVRAALVSVPSPDDPPRPPLVQAAVGEVVGLDGESYVLQASDAGVYSLVRTGRGGEAVIAECEGEPFQLILVGNTLLVPQSTPAGWDVLAYTVGASSEAAPVADADGNAVRGSGAVLSVKASEDSLTITDTTGATTVVAL